MDRNEYYKNYYMINKEKIKLQMRQNYNNNKERINVKVKCECGRILIKREMKKHLKTDIHYKCLLNKDKNKEIENNNINENEKKIHNGFAIFK